MNKVTLFSIVAMSVLIVVVVEPYILEMGEFLRTMPIEDKLIVGTIPAILIVVLLTWNLVSSKKKGHK